MLVILNAAFAFRISGESILLLGLGSLMHGSGISMYSDDGQYLLTLNRGPEECKIV